MEHEVLDAQIEGYEEFGSTAVRSGEQVFLYRRLQDAYDPALVCVVNEMNEPLGYLQRDVAISEVLPALREGVRFQCVVHGEAEGDRVPIQITPMEQAEVTAILEKRGGLRRGQSSSVPPLAGVFDEEPASDDEADEDADVVDQADDDSDAPDAEHQDDDGDDEAEDKGEADGGDKGEADGDDKGDSGDEKQAKGEDDD